jgi:hypothetical protein
MGCKTAHYLLNFAKAKEGRDWIDKYIHTYFSVGAPHLGAPKSMQCTIIGDKMGLDAFLSEEEALICARSVGSVPWMFPLTIPQGMPSAAYLQREGVLHVTVNRFDCYKMFSERKHMPVPYEEVNGAQLFRSECLLQFKRLAEEVYETDSLVATFSQ